MRKETQIDKIKLQLLLAEKNLVQKILQKWLKFHRKQSVKS